MFMVCWISVVEEFVWRHLPGPPDQAVIHGRPRSRQSKCNSPTCLQKDQDIQPNNSNRELQYTDRSSTGTRQPYSVRLKEKHALSLTTRIDGQWPYEALPVHPTLTLLETQMILVILSSVSRSSCTTHIPVQQGVSSPDLA